MAQLQYTAYRRSQQLYEPERPFSLHAMFVEVQKPGQKSKQLVCSAEAEDRIAASPAGPAESGTSEDYFNFNSSTPGGSQGTSRRRLLRLISSSQPS